MREGIRLPMGLGGMSGVLISLKLEKSLLGGARVATFARGFRQRVPSCGEAWKDARFGALSFTREKRAVTLVRGFRQRAAPSRSCSAAPACRTKSQHPSTVFQSPPVAQNNYTDFNASNRSSKRRLMRTTRQHLSPTFHRASTPFHLTLLLLRPRQGPRIRRVAPHGSTPLSTITILPRVHHIPLRPTSPRNTTGAQESAYITL